MDMAADVKWSCDEYMRERRALKEIVERRRGYDEGGIIIPSDSDEEVTSPTKPLRSGDLGQGCSKDGDIEDKPPIHDDGDDSDDYTVFYNLLGMK
ncbi:hypothetical protein D1007_13866 [Hordeum vulgare]|nr:hypothetical protein D1007_13866 [Hordeum vulgare]